MNEKLKSFLETTKKVVNKLFLYVVIAGSIIAAYLFGAEHTKLTQTPVKHTVEVLKIKKSDVNLAIDEDNHLIIINNKTGNYTMYQDSIGKTIFKLYAKNVWGQNSALMVK